MQPGKNLGSEGVMFTSTKLQFPHLPKHGQQLTPRAGHRTGRMCRNAQLGTYAQQLLCLHIATTKVTPFSGNAAKMRHQASTPRHCFSPSLPAPSLVHLCTQCSNSYELTELLKQSRRPPGKVP